jgi:hypothetical protein
MRRDELAAAESLEDPGRFYVVLRGMITAGGRVFRPGETLGPGIGAVRAVTPATLASCDAETYEELVRPLCG